VQEGTVRGDVVVPLNPEWEVRFDDQLSQLQEAAKRACLRDAPRRKRKLLRSSMWKEARNRKLSPYDLQDCWAFSSVRVFRIFGTDDKDL